MSALFTSIYIIWALSEVFINRFLRSGAGDKKNQDKNSLAFIWITVVLSMALAVYIATSYYFPLSTWQNTRYFGLVFIVTGIVLRLVIIASLGKYFTADVTIRQGHQLKKDSFYKYLRHPSYSASMLSFIGFGIFPE